jgi:hypothetical protein
MWRAILAWALEEWRLMRAPSWDAGVYDGCPAPGPCTRLDPRCRRLELKQRRMRQQLRRTGVERPRVPIAAFWEHDERAFRFVRRVT